MPARPNTLSLGCVAVALLLAACLTPVEGVKCGTGPNEATQGWGRDPATGQCKRCADPQCLWCNAYGDYRKCNQCGYGYWLNRSTFRCNVCTAGCANCIVCPEGATCPGGLPFKCTRKCNIEECDVCPNAPNKCASCATGFYFNGAGKCVACNLDFCADCEQCSSGKGCVQGRKCIKPCNDKHCDACGPDGMCRQCTYGYWLDKTNLSCKTCKSVMPGCTNCLACSTGQPKQCQKNAYYCYKCASGYTLKNGLCKKN